MDNITIGCLVRVQLPSDYSIDGIVKYIPCGEGDSWRIMPSDGKEVCVQRFETIKLLERAPNNLDEARKTNKQSVAQG